MAQPFIRVVGIVTGIMQSQNNFVNSCHCNLLSRCPMHEKKLDLREGSDAAMASAIVNESWGKQVFLLTHNNVFGYSS
jgi:hypothetical protein